MTKNNLRTNAQERGWIMSQHHIETKRFYKIQEHEQRGEVLIASTSEDVIIHYEGEEDKRIFINYGQLNEMISILETIRELQDTE